VGEREKVIIGAGRLNSQKNFPLLISSFAQIAKDFPGYKLRIYGKGALLESLQSLAKEKGVGDRVEFPGYVPNMPEVLEKASMFVLSSDFEGMPNALMEAMASGLPCISTDCGGGGARFLIEDGENGLLVPQKDEVAMAEAMRKILSDDAFANKIAENARKLQENLAPEKIYGEWEKFILKKTKEK
jgi:glycosyltransferase involved in cell wall biosynthesis